MEFIDDNEQMSLVSNVGDINVYFDSTSNLVELMPVEGPAKNSASAIPEQNLIDVQCPYEVIDTVPFSSTQPIVYGVGEIGNQENCPYRLLDYSIVGKRRRGRPPKSSTPMSTRGVPHVHIPGNNLAFNTSVSMMLNTGNSFNSDGDSYFDTSSFSLNSIPSDSFSTPVKVLHKDSERKRRNRIKNSCEQLRHLVPFLNDKSDNATILEATVQFLTYIKANHQQIYDNY